MVLSHYIGLENINMKLTRVISRQDRIWSLHDALDGVDPGLLLALALGHEVVRLARARPLRPADLEHVLRLLEGRRVSKLCQGRDSTE